MKQTAVEWLCEQYHLKQDIEIVKQAREMEKQQQGYTKADMQTAWNSSEQNMRFQFSSSAYKNVTFEKWLSNFNEE